MFKLNKKMKTNIGMTYVELIVVLSIFSVLSSIVLFNYGEFQSKVDLKNLASDIALKIVEAQKASLSGKLPLAGHSVTSDWKPSYGVHFDITPGTGDNQKLIYFVDQDAIGVLQNNLFDGSFSECTGECLEEISITKGDYISAINKIISGVSSPVDDLTVTFSRINSGMVFASGSALLSNTVSSIEITITSPKSTNVIIKLYPSGRIELK
ncbi:hypothetical protein A2814_02060 [Candidatus Nomurabacteria bacterium RIFCSPHIGHO2_01_FULL_38_19]|uniref:General secretion pathway GspH domain-containing protein n=1 Tax=Candidatus Nomurabacteria bacterium RIFCSPHIGHO2_01_FULL_38_19 TaxID=1801732 RepID=A0A1F6UUV0_9BACT|nr:MAG: hypothetical protein A2814_02060 [Candidatus Nomurabacteria bacterium RIFCSPHIGHO2_01_FULL_38_19]